MKFAEYRIAPEVKENLENMGFRRPTDIQFKSIPPILKGEDLLAIAQTGTGKTAAFAIPIVSILQNRKTSNRSLGVHCLVMAPTHELAIQIFEVFKSIAEHTKVKVACIYGGVEQDPQIAQLQKGVDILVATPGRMFDLVSQQHLLLNNVEILVLDEADHMLALGFLKDIQQLVRKLPTNRQTLFFSATIDEEIKRLAYSLVRNAIRIQISPKNSVSKNVEHAMAYIAMDDKRFFLERIIKENPDKKLIVFVRTKVRAERVFKAMERVEVETITLHGDKDQKEREASLDAFKNGHVKVLVTTDISARGIDIPGVDIVINYDIPDQEDYYVHRVGRTGRGTNRGRAISFCSPEEKEEIAKIEEYIGQEIRVMEIDKKTYKETLILSDENFSDLKSMMKELEGLEEKKRKSQKRRK
jgi:ATP-dependent RNA helicase RhlE